jgi:membrane protein implicated in regulation of membrane protease activity
MATYLLWAIAGFVLIITELMTGTFYLLVLGIAALVAAAAAFLGAGFWVQVMLAAATALIGIYFLRKWWTNHPKHAQGGNSLDVGQTVILETWTNQATGMARVKYRGSTWDAQVQGTAAPNDVLVIKSEQSGVLHVTAKQ